MLRLGQKQFEGLVCLLVQRHGCEYDTESFEAAHFRKKTNGTRERHQNMALGQCKTYSKTLRATANAEGHQPHRLKNDAEIQFTTQVLITASREGLDTAQHIKLQVLTSQLDQPTR